MPLLRVEHLSVTRGDRTLVADLNFVLDAGEVLHLRGANGIGKTSLLEMLAGVRAIDGGKIVRPQESGGLHWLGHRNGLNPHLSAIENLRFWCGLNQVSDAGIGAALERLGLAPRARTRPARTLSAGQKRRTALTRLLLAPRPLWLLDEPLDGLDVSGLALFAELLGEHLERGGAALVTSHQPLPRGLRSVRNLVLDT